MDGDRSLADVRVHPGVVIGYDPRLTVASLTVGVVMAVGMLALLRQAAGTAQAAALGLCFGLGVGAMHFSGMAGMEVPGALVWTRSVVLASLLIGTGLAATAFAVFVSPRVRHSNAIATTLLTAAIAGLHFTAMAAVEIVPELASQSPEPGLPRLTLAFGVAAVMLTVLSFAILALFADRMRRTNQALSASERRFRLLAESTSDVIIWCNLDGTHRYVSPAAKKLLGYEPEELVGTRALDSVHPDEAEDYRSVLPTAQTRERALAVEIADLTATLLLASVVEPDDLTRKLITLIAMAEPGPADAAAFPGRYLRTLLADFIQLHGLASANP